MTATERFRYDSPVILVGGGDVNWKKLDYVVDLGHPIVAVDSGAVALRTAGILPDLIIGDMDSVSDDGSWPATTEIIEISEQDTTDFEKCLYTVPAPLYLAFGFLGKRLDHSLATLHCLIKYRTRRSVVLIDSVDLMFIPTVPLAIVLPLNSRLSINPVAPVSFVESTGLKYPLDGLTMETGVAIGTSNTVTDARVTISPEEPQRGNYMVITPDSSLPCVIDWYGDR